MDVLLLPPVNSIDTWMCKAINKDGNFINGLAIIIGSKNSCIPGHKPLHGVVHDVEKLRETFSKLRFTTLCLLNPTKKHIVEVIKYTSKLDADAIRRPESWKRIVVTFSGHGGENYLCTYDDTIDLDEDIVTPLLAKNSETLAFIPKLFFIDACRGDKVDTGVSIIDRFSRGGLQSRGVTKVPSRGDYLIACSTLKGMKSFEKPENGGCWMQALTEKLLSFELINESIEGVLKEVNKILTGCYSSPSMSQVFQQPEYTSTLKNDIKLLQEAKGEGFLFLFFVIIIITVELQQMLIHQQQQHLIQQHQHLNQHHGEYKI